MGFFSDLLAAGIENLGERGEIRNADGALIELEGGGDITERILDGGRRHTAVDNA